MEELALPFCVSEKGLKRMLEDSSGKRVELVITENSSRMLSVRRCHGGVRLRAHRMFLSAPPAVIDEIASFISGRAVRTALVKGFIRQRSGEIKPRQNMKRPVTKGRHHDLLPMFERLNGKYFGGSLASVITWSRRQPGRVRRRTLGSYGFISGVIRINPVLDSPMVPSFFVEFIVYHEMLHAHLGSGESGCRRRIHSKEFRQKEREYEFIKKVQEWERANRRIL